MTLRAVRYSFLAAVFASLGACQTHAASAPAVLADASEENISALKMALAASMGVARVELGAGDLEAAATIAVLPPRPGPSETKSLARPILFDLEIEDGQCSAVRRDTSERVPLTGVRCRAAA